MNCRIFAAVIAGCLMATGNCRAQQDDPVVMRIGDYQVSRSEFEYNFNKNNSEDAQDRKAIGEYVPLFVNYRLKVQAALDAHMDTLSSYQSEFRMYRDQQIRPLLVQEPDREQEAKAYYEKMLNALGGKDLRLPAHIFLRVQQNSTAEQQASQKTRIDSIYNALKQGADFETLARQLSQDPQSARQNGQLMWCGPGQLIPEFEEVMYKLNKGEISEPFLSSVGYHIVRLNDQKQLEPYDTLRPQILNFLESRGLSDRLAKTAVDSLAKQRGITPAQLMDEETERLCAQDNDLKYLIQEYHDGLLLYEYCKTQIWDPAEKDTLGMEKYFKKNKKQYAWSTPHFYGMLYHTKQADHIKTVKNLTKKAPEKEWTRIVRKQMNADSVQVRMEQRLFTQGENATVDSLAFGLKEGKTKTRTDFPYAGLVGRKLKKGPKVWTDVAAQVKEDYRNKQEEAAVEALREKYSVVVDEEVLKTVNNH